MNKDDPNIKLYFEYALMLLAKKQRSLLSKEEVLAGIAACIAAYLPEMNLNRIDICDALHQHAKSLFALYDPYREEVALRAKEEYSAYLHQVIRDSNPVRKKIATDLMYPQAAAQKEIYLF